MKVDLDSNQFVIVDSNNRVRFHHYSNSDTLHTVTLSYYQFLNFHDVICGLSYFTRLTWYPLGDGMWFYKKNDFVKLFNSKQQCFFRFYRHGWKTYKNHLHHTILSFLRYGSLTSHHQSHARDENRSRDYSRRCLRNVRKRKQILSRASGNDSDENGVKWSKPPNISQRKGSNSRPPLGRRSGRHAARIHSEIEESKEDGVLSSIASDNSEYGGEPNIDISD